MRRSWYFLIAVGLLFSPTITRAMDDPPQKKKSAPAASDLKQAIQDEINAFQKKMDDWQKAATEARNEQPPRQLNMADRPKPETAAKKMLALIEKQPEDPAVVPGLNWIVMQRGIPATLTNQAVDLIVKHHIDNKLVAPNLQRLAILPDMQKLVNAALESKSEEVKGAAHYGVGVAIMRKADNIVSVAKTDPNQIKERYEKMIADLDAKIAKAEKDTEKKNLEQQKNRLESNLTAVVESATKRKADAEKDLPQVSAMKKDARAHLEKALPSLKETDPQSALFCQGALNDLSGKLDPGATAMEITAEDVDGKNFKLSDYRGKVVMLDFWGHW